MEGLSHGLPVQGLTLRRESDGSEILDGIFPYDETAILSDGGRTGRPRKEKFDHRAMKRRIEAQNEEIHLLVGHDFNRPLASKLNGTLNIQDTREAVRFQAKITREIAETQHGKDTLAMIRAGLAVGISPGFRLPPERAVPREKAEEIIDEGMNPDAGEFNAIIRVIKQALLFELSIVTTPAYKNATVEARQWHPDNGAKPGPVPHFLRYR